MTPARSKIKTPLRRLGEGLRAGARRAAVAAALGGALIAPANAEESTLFSDLSTTELLELSADLGEELHRRGVMTDTRDPSRDYARHLSVRAFELSGAPGGYEDTGGLRYRIEGVRRLRGREALVTGPLDDLSTAEYDFLVIVIFRRDFQIDRAAMAPIDVVRELAAAPDPTADPTITLDEAFWATAGVEDVTGFMFLAASEDQ